jgi:acyl carrier protein
MIFKGVHYRSDRTLGTQNENCCLLPEFSIFQSLLFGEYAMDTNSQKLITCVAEGLGIPESSITDDLAYNTIPEWDSRGHMVLITEIEIAFDIMMDTDDIIALSSVGKAKEILAKYGVAFVEEASYVN